jgi:hypothetical protein
MESPAFSDSRQQDVAAVRAALDRAATSGKTTKLAMMTAAELCALGALSHPLIDAAALSWWDAQADQEQVSRAAYGYLAHRKLIDPETGRISPPLGLILAGRSRPAFIMLSREHPAAEPNMLHVYGIAEDPGVLRAVLVEVALPTSVEWAGPAYEYALAGTAQAGRKLAEWAAAGKRRTLDLYLPGRGTILPAERIVVTPARHPNLRVERQTPSAETPESLPCDMESLADVLAGVMMGACR